MEAELVAATLFAQDMLFIIQVLESIELKVKKPMIFKVDNQSTKDLTNNLSVIGQTWNNDAKTYFLRELKKQGIFKTNGYWERRIAVFMQYSSLLWR